MKTDTPLLVGWLALCSIVSLSTRDATIAVGAHELQPVEHFLESAAVMA